MRKENKGKEGVPKKKQTQRFRERGEIGVGKKKRGDLRDGGELFGNRGGKNIARGQSQAGILDWKKFKHKNKNKNKITITIKN